MTFGPDNTIIPTTREVAVHIKNRTVDSGNNFLGDFTDETSVTAEEVVELIDKVEEWVLRRLNIPSSTTIVPDPGPSSTTIEFTDETKRAIRSLIALGAAALVELTKFSEQIARGVSPYPYLKDLFDEQLASLYESVTGNSASGSGGESLWDLVGKQFGLALYGFPDDPMVGWKTAF